MEHHTISLLLDKFCLCWVCSAKSEQVLRNFNTLFDIVVDGSAKHLLTENQIIAKFGVHNLRS